MTRLSAVCERTPCVSGRWRTWQDPLEVHPPTVLVAAASAGLLLLGHVRDQRLRRQNHGRDGGCVLQCRAGDLGGVDDPLLEEVAVLALECVVAVAGLQRLDVLDNHFAVRAGVVGDLAGRGLEGLAHDVDADLGIAFELDLVEGRDGLQEGGAAAGDEALFDGRTGRRECILDAVLLLLELDLGGCADLDDGDATGQLGQALLELLTVVVRGGLLDLRLDLAHATLDLVGLAVAVDDRRVVLGRDDATGRTEVLDGDRVELAPDLLADDGAAGQDGDVTQHLLAAIAEARRLDGKDLDGATELVHDERGESLAVDVLADDQRGLALGHGLLERRQHVLDGRDLLVRDQDERVVEDSFHAVRVGHEVRRDVAAIELHALGVFLLEAQALALFDGDDAVLADLVHHLGDDLADFRIRGGDGGDGRDLLAVVDRAGLLLDLLDDGLDGGLDAALDDHRVGPGGHDAEAL